jgi:eukaryotic-like serine/threonine-protein kinase
VTLVSGTRLGPYEITAKLGEGGMGEVYRATDTKLKRDVAIKVLPAAFTEDKERLQRFEREAQLLAQLHHPNIASIFGLEESDGTKALVMELVEGPTLAERLESGALPLDESLSIARQIAEALEEAHEKGIIHRDLKPQNVKASIEGNVKVLDFGLAKAMDPAGAASGSTSSSQLAASPTLTLGATQMGVILGTAAYMAPEQAKGRPVDRRADIWAFGCVLFEMLAGRAAFAADTVPDTLAAVLTREIDFAALPESTPPAIRRLLRRCLTRKPRERLRDIGDARIVIDEVLTGRFDEPAAATAAAEAVVAAPVRSWRPLALGLVAGAALASAVAVGIARSAPAPAEVEPPAVRSLTYTGWSSDASVSSDGRTMAFFSPRDGTSRIWLQQLGSGEEVAIAEGFAPRISPDGASVVFGRDRAIFRMPAIGGTPRRLAEGNSPIWSPDGREVAFLRQGQGGGEAFRIPAEGGEERPIRTRDGSRPGLGSSWRWSPDGAHIASFRSGLVNTIASTTVDVLELASGELRELARLPAGSNFYGLAWDGDDALLYAWSPTAATGRGARLSRVPLSGGEPRTVFSFGPTPNDIELAARGTLVFGTLERRANLFEVAGSDARGRPLTRGPAIDRQPAFSPDGLRIVFTSDRSGNQDLWSLELASGALRRLTFDPADDWDPQWSPDGEHLLWSSNRGGHYEVWIAAADGGGARQLTRDGVDAENPTMSSDGEWVVYSSGNPAGTGIWKIRADGSDAQLLLPGAWVLPELSAANGWVAAAASTSSRSRDGLTEVRVVRLEDGALVGTVSIPTTVWGNTGRSRWLPDGRTLILFGGGRGAVTHLFRVTVEPGREVGGPELAPIVTAERGARIESFAVSPVDGRIVVSSPSEERDIAVATGISGIGGSLPEWKP